MQWGSKSTFLLSKYIIPVYSLQRLSELSIMGRKQCGMNSNNFIWKEIIQKNLQVTKCVLYKIRFTRDSNNLLLKIDTLQLVDNY